MGAMVRTMALTPETASALKQAIEAIVQECGDDPQYSDLVEALQTAEHAIPEGEGHDAPHGDHEGGDEADGMSADDMFAHAEAQHKERRKPKSKGDDHENPFKKGDQS